jgi:hypothetical protein
MRIMARYTCTLFFWLIICLPIWGNSKLFWVAGDLVGVGSASGRSYFSVRNDSSGRVQHVICQDSVVKDIAKQFAQSENNPNSSKIHVNVKAKIIRIGSPLLQCSSHPLLRNSSKYSQANNPNSNLSATTSVAPSQGIDRTHWGSKRIIGQVLEADPQSGLLTIQSALKKNYLKVSPEMAAMIHKKLSEMEIHNIDDTFHYDRDRGYFVGSK